MSDRFTQAYSELTEKNPYLCESCMTAFGHPTITHLAGDSGTAGRHARPDVLTRNEDIFDGASVPFGD